MVNYRKRIKAEKLSIQLGDVLVSKMAKLYEQGKLKACQEIGKLKNIRNRLDAFREGVLKVNPTTELKRFTKDYEEILKEIEELEREPQKSKPI